MININNKICCRCLQEKSCDKFGKCKKYKDGLRCECKECRKTEYYKDHENSKLMKRLDHQKHRLARLLKAKEYYKENAEEIKQKTNNYYYENIDEVKLQRKGYRERNKEKITQKKHDYYLKKKAMEPPKIDTRPPEVIAGTHRICSKCKEMKEMSFFINSYYCSPCKTIRNREHRKNNIDKIIAREHKYYKDEHAKIRARKSKWNKSEAGRAADKAYKSQEWVRIANCLRANLRKGLNYCHLDKEYPTSTYLGCTWSFFHKYFESLFINGMNWNCYNKGEIDIDHHYLPLCILQIVEILNLNKLEVVFVVSNYRNLKPMWEPDNAAKAARDKEMKKNPELVLKEFNRLKSEIIAADEWPTHLFNNSAEINQDIQEQEPAQDDFLL